MSYKQRQDNLGNRAVGLATASPSDNRALGITGYTAEATNRTDHNDAASNDSQEFADVAATVTGVIGIVNHEPCQAGVYVWAITAGNSSGDFAISSKGELSRVNGHTLTGPYTLTVRHTEGSPLFRFRDVSVSVTVAA